MTWGNAGALTGLLVVALPVIIHVLGRDPATRRRFPSLRFIEASRLLPTRWSRVHDPVLLTIRCALLTLAVAALARPSRNRAPVAPATEERLARVVLLDTAAMAYSAHAADARAMAQAFMDSASRSIVVLSADPVEDLRGAGSWLERDDGRHELVIMSDFAESRYPMALSALVAPTVGLRFVRLPVGDTIARVRRATPPAPGARATAPPLSVVSSNDEADFARAVTRAVSQGLRSSTSAPVIPVALVLRSATERAELLRRSRPVSNPAVVRLTARLTRDAFALPLDADLHGGATAVVPQKLDQSAPVPPTGSVVLARGRDGAIALWAREDSTSAAPRLLVFSELPARSAAIAVAAAAVGATALPTTDAVGDGLLPDSVLRGWERPATPRDAVTPPVSSPDVGGSLARLLWCAVLALLLIESVVRRRSGSAPVAEGG